MSAPAPTAWSRYLAVRTFGCLDGLRALSILAVVFHHAHPGTGWIATHRGFLGVDLFFVISGFLIVTLLLRERDRRGAISLPAFYARRSLRIFPLYYTVLLLLWLGTQATGGSQAGLVRADLPYALTYTANWVPMVSILSVTWSLAAEEQFYLVWPAIERFLRGVAAVLLFGLLSTSAAISCLHAHAGWFAGFPPMLLQTTFVPILLGVALAHQLHDAASFARWHRWLGHAVAAPLLLVGIVAAASVPGDDISGAPRLGLHVLFTLLVGACVVREDNGLRPLLRRRAMVRIGAVSYGIYLLHMPVLHFSQSALAYADIADGWSRFAAGTAATWLLAEISFRTLERWCQRHKGRWAR